jgi:meiotic recombination protein SPO11
VASCLLLIAGNLEQKRPKGGKRIGTEVACLLAWLPFFGWSVLIMTTTEATSKSSSFRCVSLSASSDGTTSPSRNGGPEGGSGSSSWSRNNKNDDAILLQTIGSRFLIDKKEEEDPIIADVPDVAAADEVEEYSTDLVLRRMERLAEAILELLHRGELPVMVDGGTVASDSSAAAAAAVVKKFDLRQCRSFTSVLLVVSYCQCLVLQRLTTSTARELYYFFVTHFRSQRECDAAVRDACALLRLPRHALHLQASSRGWMCGDITLYSRRNRKRRPSASTDLSNSTHSSAEVIHAAPDEDDRDGSSRNERVLWNAGSEQAFPVAPEWLLPTGQRPFQLCPQTSARCIVVVEKEGVFHRLQQDGFDRHHRCILITGKGFPDQATRAALHQLRAHLGGGGGDTAKAPLPVFGLADCDPFGVHILHCYRQGRYGVPVQWLGLRPSQVKYLSSSSSSTNACGSGGDGGGGGGMPGGGNSDGGVRPAFPKSVFQELTELDRKRLESILAQDDHDDDDDVDIHSTSNLHGFVDGSHHRLQELECLRSTKVELEALYWLGMDFCSEFVGTLLEAAMEQQQETEAEKNAKGVHWARAI